jgi:hypothetical protein
MQFSELRLHPLLAYGCADCPHFDVFVNDIPLRGFLGGHFLGRIPVRRNFQPEVNPTAKRHHSHKQFQPWLPCSIVFDHLQCHVDGHGDRLTATKLAG